MTIHVHTALAEKQRAPSSQQNPNRCHPTSRPVYARRGEAFLLVRVGASGRDRTGNLPLTRNTNTPDRRTSAEVDDSLREAPVAGGCCRCCHRVSISSILIE
jgi:hypothetical protein